MLLKYSNSILFKPNRHALLSHSLLLYAEHALLVPQSVIKETAEYRGL